MELASILRDLWRRRLLVLLLVALGLLAALATAYKLPSFQQRSLQLGAASSQILVDAPHSSLVQGAESNALATLATRARIYAQYLSSPEAREQISKASGIPAAKIVAKGPFSTDTGRVSYEPQPSEVRSKGIVDEKSGYRLVFTAQEGVPIISVSAQAPSAEAAVKLAGGSFTALRSYVASLARESARDGGSGDQIDVTVRELGAPEGGTIGGSNNILLMVFAFFAVVGLGCLLIPVTAGLMRNWRLLDEAERSLSDTDPTDVWFDQEHDRDQDHEDEPVDGNGRAKDGRVDVGPSVGVG